MKTFLQEGGVPSCEAILPKIPPFLNKDMACRTHGSKVRDRKKNTLVAEVKQIEFYTFDTNAKSE